MILLSSTIILFGSISFACLPQVCDAICKKQGEARGIVYKGTCGCWNPEDISKLVTFVPANGKAVIDPKPKYIWEQ